MRALYDTNTGGVYPRVCGGTSGHGGRQHVPKGLSPACAGEPGHCRVATQEAEVYPRVCGGTMRRWDGRENFQGLSPRVRGNLAKANCVISGEGSIPACAGEPATPRPRTTAGRVYPRVCGGTDLGWRHFYLSLGLSPRVRGNLDKNVAALFHQGSIPACAGEPSLIPWLSGTRTVYPRVCGGTSASVPASWRSRGLSPRVRGNLDGSDGHDRV